MKVVNISLILGSCKLLIQCVCMCFCYKPSVHKKSLQDLCILVNSEDPDEMCGISLGSAIFVE